MVASHRLAQRSLVAMLAALALAIVGLSSTAPDASATCHPYPELISMEFGDEDAAAGTCDGDGFYRGMIRDTLTDGSCVWIEYSDGSYTGTQGQACSSSWVTYRFWDQTGDNSAIWRLCRRQGCSSWGWIGNFGY